MVNKLKKQFFLTFCRSITTRLVPSILGTTNKFKVVVPLGDSFNIPRSMRFEIPSRINSR